MDRDHMYAGSDGVGHSGPAPSLLGGDPSQAGAVYSEDVEGAFTANNLIVNYLPSALNEAEFKRLFDPYGTVIHYKLVLDKRDLTSKGYGFIKYEHEDQAAAAVAAVNGMDLWGKRLKVSIARPRNLISGNGNLYVAGLPLMYGESHLHRMFSPFGSIVEARALRDRATGILRGVAFVRYAHRSEAEAAVASLNNMHIQSSAELKAEYLEMLGQPAPEEGFRLTVRFAEDHTRKPKVPAGAPGGAMGPYGGGAPGGKPHMGGYPHRPMMPPSPVGDPSGAGMYMYPGMHAPPHAQYGYGMAAAAAAAAGGFPASPGPGALHGYPVDGRDGVGAPGGAAPGRDGASGWPSAAGVDGSKGPLAKFPGGAQGSGVWSGAPGSPATDLATSTGATPSGDGMVSTQAPAGFAGPHGSFPAPDGTNPAGIPGPGMYPVPPGAPMYPPYAMHGATQAGHLIPTRPQHAPIDSGPCLFVYNLPHDVDENVLLSLFAYYATVTSVKVARDSRGVSKGFGFVNMLDSVSADIAIQQLNGAPVGGRVLQVSYKRNRSEY